MILRICINSLLSMAFPFRPITYRKTPPRSAQRGFSGGTGGFHHLSFLYISTLCGTLVASGIPRILRMKTLAIGIVFTWRQFDCRLGWNRSTVAPVIWKRTESMYEILHFLKLFHNPSALLSFSNAFVSLRHFCRHGTPLSSRKILAHWYKKCTFVISNRTFPTMILVASSRTFATHHSPPHLPHLLWIAMPIVINPMIQITASNAKTMKPDTESPSSMRKNC